MQILMGQSSAPECSEVSTTDSPPRRPARPRSCPRACRGAGSRSPSSWWLLLRLCVSAISRPCAGSCQDCCWLGCSLLSTATEPLSLSHWSGGLPSRHLNIKFTSKTSEKRTGTGFPGCRGVKDSFWRDRNQLSSDWLRTWPGPHLAHTAWCLPHVVSAWQPGTWCPVLLSSQVTTQHRRTDGRRYPAIWNR